MRTVTWQQLEDQVLIARATGADRERRRIRKAQRDALVVINGFNVPERLWKAAMKQLDAATRAKKGKRK